MMWRTQYRAIMLFLFTIIVGLGFYMDDPTIALNAGSILLLFIVLVKVAEFVMKLFGKVLFYDIKIINKDKIA